ncbi:bifunctional diguanylate cyclase/phosphodiesterase [Devosia sp. XJ19-1]|uniref:Bifunctional diguanylate cyclase/phosphodiesterase n=1 Tax=Devosia ureilytica TaxID=2952754 RepID=A0A9Q4FSK3_9HYPH|nr:bifunctional diguanylate cyclase/phosphodiesterase [Devosia ureilytica]MCP8882672.1 bifunctional diguanylate cyclase/phosphodiesterase [Devosia ureilytica]MCP8886960.1 bifunctional diguanylate cyclase/phosphodiesterase [Devosia ureilytica]
MLGPALDHPGYTMQVRPNFALVNQAYDWLRLTIGLLAIMLLGLSLATLLGFGSQSVIAWIMAGLAITIPVVLLQAHRLLRRRLAEAQAAMAEALASANRDALTGTFTRSYFLDELQRFAHRGSLSALGYLQIDMDNLKVLNDSAGHGAGDAALVALVREMRALMPNAIIGRLGGDEFGVLIPGHDNKGGLCRLGDRLLRQLNEPHQIAGRMTRLSATIGVALAPLDSDDPNELIAIADLALYKGKHAGRGCVVPFDPDMLGDERHRRFVERELRAAILMDELELHYQPVFDSATLTVRSHEALVRWRHKVRGTIAPGQFIGVAEQSSLIDRLGEWVLRRACADLPRLKGPVAVNVSPVQLRRAEFAESFADILIETGTSPTRIIVEITENAPLAAGSVEMNNLTTLRAMGVRVAIDDFGAGHASLHYLRDFAFDIIKIDRTYVADFAANPVNAMIVSAVCDIARSLKLEVVAEGIETEEQLQMLVEAGCTALQGYHLGRPQPLVVQQVVCAA